MTELKYFNVFKKLLVDLGTYKPQFDYTLKVLAKTFVTLERIEKEARNQPLFYLRDGLPIEHPVQKMLTREKTSAMTQLRELGLTPKGFKGLNLSVDESADNVLSQLLSGDNES